MRRRNPAKWLFVVAFAISCALFWWFPSVLLRSLDLPDTIERSTFVESAAALLCFLAAYLAPIPAVRHQVVSRSTMDLCESFSYKATLLFAFPAFAVGLAFALYRAGLAYGEGHDIPLLYQAVLYIHMFFAYMYLGSVPDLEGRRRRRVLLIAALVIFPRLLISLHWARFFVGQTLVVILLMATARGWLRLSAVRWIQLAVLAAVIVIVPAVTRGDQLTGEDEYGQSRLVLFFQGGSTLGFFQDYKERLRWSCPPLLVSMTAKLIPYHALRLCTVDVGSVNDMPATINSLLTRQESNDLSSGTGGNYMLELYLMGGISVVVAGSALFGASCRWMIEHLRGRSLLSGIWAECLVRALFAPRNNLGYVYERIPSLLLATFAVIILCKSANILRRA